MTYWDIETEAPAARSAFLQWSICAAVVLTVHGLIVLALAPRADEADPEAGSPIVTVELAPTPVAPPAPPNELAPGPLQPQAETEEREKADARPERQEAPPVQDETRTPDPVATLPPPVPKPAEQVPDKTAEQEPTEASPVPTAPPNAEAPAAQAAAPAVGSVARPTSAAVVGWQRQLMAQLQRHKRYPPAANGAQGTARLAFAIDRRGHLMTSQIVRSSGSSILDEETLALIKRAAPFPAPPTELPDAQLSFTVPIRFAASGAR